MVTTKLNDFEKFLELRGIHADLTQIQRMLEAEGAEECARLILEAKSKIAEVGMMCKTTAENDDPDRYGQ